MKYYFNGNSILQRTRLSFSQNFSFFAIHSITPFKAGKPLQGKELQDKEHKNEKHIGEQIKKSLKMNDKHFRCSLNQN